jgi:hypothetical protein
LKRLVLSVSKKLSKTDRGKRLKGQPSTSSKYSFHGENQEVDISGMTNEKFWRIGQQKPLTIQVSVDEASIPLHVECNPPTVSGVSTFEKFAGKIFPHIALVVEVDVLYATHAVVDWYVDSQLVCHDSQAYTPTLDDVNKTLAIMITPTRPGHKGEGCQEAYQFQEKVAPSVPENTVMQIRPEWLIPRAQKSSELRVLSYNILADQNVFTGNKRDHCFPWVSADVLIRSRRMPLILHEILAYQADIICLQEVDELVYDTLFRPVLEHLNYQGYFSVKQSNGTREGSAIFWSLKRFQRASAEDRMTFGLSQLLNQYVTPLEEGCEWKECADTVRKLFHTRPDLEDTIQKRLGHTLMVSASCVLFFY